METVERKKTIPNSVLIFGAANHIGMPMARYFEKKAPHIKLHLASTSEERAKALSESFPNAKVVVANLSDLASLESAVDGVEGIYLATPNMLEPYETTKNFISAVKASGSIKHIVRAIGIMPEYNKIVNPVKLPNPPGAEAIPDIVFKKMLDESGLPVTYLNFGASFMDNFLKVTKIAIQKERKFVWHNRKVPYIDPVEIAEIAANILLSDNAGHIGLFHTMNNGNDNLTASQVADLMSEVFGEKISYDGSKEAFIAHYEPIFGPGAQFVWQFFEYEKGYEEGWALNDFAERMLGRKPKTLAAWLVENKKEILGL